MLRAPTHDHTPFYETTHVQNLYPYILMLRGVLKTFKTVMRSVVVTSPFATLVIVSHDINPFPSSPSPDTHLVA